jgi:hypothetical protein
MIRALRLRLLFEAVTFAVAAAIHFGALLDGCSRSRSALGPGRCSTSCIT